MVARNRIVTVLAALASLVVVSFLVTRASNAAFTDTESSNGSFSAGSIDLTDDVASTLFTASNLVPGQTVQSCLVVTYQGSVADPNGVRVYSGGVVDNGLAPHLDVVIEEGTGGSSSSCTGFTPSGGPIFNGTLEGFGTAHTSYATGAGTWDPSSTPASRSYRVTATLGNDTPNSAQGDDASATFTWEVQS